MFSLLCFKILENGNVMLETNRQKLITNFTPSEIENTFGEPDGENFQVIEIYLFTAYQLV